jgi:CRP/FNR family transcriptional regulator
VALDTVYVCRFSFPALATLASKIPNVQQRLFELLSADIGRVTQRVGDHPADERLAAFLLELSERFAARGFSASTFNLTMSRVDIANYLRLAAETVSRVLRRLQEQGLIRIDGRAVELIDLPQLRQLAHTLRAP